MAGAVIAPKAETQGSAPFSHMGLRRSGVHVRSSVFLLTVFQLECNAAFIERLAVAKHTTEKTTNPTVLPAATKPKRKKTSPEQQEPKAKRPATSASASAAISQQPTIRVPATIRPQPPAFGSPPPTAPLSTMATPMSAASSEDTDTPRASKEKKFLSTEPVKQLNTIYKKVDRQGDLLRELLQSDKERQKLLFELQVDRQQFALQMNAALETGLAPLRTIAEDIAALRESHTLLEGQLQTLAAAVDAIAPQDMTDVRTSLGALATAARQQASSIQVVDANLRQVHRLASAAAAMSTPGPSAPNFGFEYQPSQQHFQMPRGMFEQPQRSVAPRWQPALQGPAVEELAPAPEFEEDPKAASSANASSTGGKKGPGRPRGPPKQQ